MVKNGCGHSGFKTLNLVVSQEGINVITRFLVCWYKFSKGNNFWVVVAKNGHGFLALGALESTLYQEWIDEMSRLSVDPDTNLEKLKITLLIIGWAW